MIPWNKKKDVKIHLFNFSFNLFWLLYWNTLPCIIYQNRSVLFIVLEAGMLQDTGRFGVYWRLIPQKWFFFMFPCDRKRGKQFSSSTSINPLNLFVGGRAIMTGQLLNLSPLISIVFSFYFSTWIVGESIVMAKITFSNLGMQDMIKELSTILL